MSGIYDKLRMLRHYLGAFTETVRTNGWSFAIRRAHGFLRGRRANRYIGAFHQKQPDQNDIQDIIESLKMRPLSRPLLLIISDTQIRQCIHYRIHQKKRYLDEIGVQTMYIPSDNMGRVRSFLNLAHTVIIYRTVISSEQIAEFRNAGLRIIFEFDDLVVGRKTLKGSGILKQLTARQNLGLIDLAGKFLETAQACDEIIVSTPYLAELYAKPENGLAYKTCHVIPNFVETENYSFLGEKDFTFAYTSPSGSIHDEVKMMASFLSGYDITTDYNWTILIMGNDFAYNELNAMGFVKGTVIFQPMTSFEEYLRNIARAQTVLIPLADHQFNRSKTPIRLLDAAISGTQALFSPVGDYQSVQMALSDDRLCISSDKWENAGYGIAPILAREDANLSDLQNAVRILYGREAAILCYRSVFIGRMGLRTKMKTELVTSR